MAIAVKGHQRGSYLPAVRRSGMMAGVDPGGHEDYSSPEQRSTDLLTWTLRPWLYPHRAGRLDAAALDPAGKFNAGALVRATLLDRYTAHKLGIEAGWLLRSEVRELEDRPSIPGIDDRPPPEVGVA
jgi:phage portal protein BeeE